MARPTIYSDELATSICVRLSLGESLNKICMDESSPSKSAVFNWLASNDKFMDKYRRARELQQEHYLDEIIEIADDSSNDYIETDNGTRPNSVNVQRCKLRIETRRWTMERLAARKYGNNIEVIPDDTEKDIPIFRLVNIDDN